MEITVQELRKLKEESYQVIDIRSEADVSYGTMPGAICVSPDAIEENPLIDFSKKQRQIQCRGGRRTGGKGL